MNPFKSLAALRYRFVEMESQLQQTYSLVKRSRDLLDAIAAWTRNEPLPAPTYIYLIPPTGPFLALHKRVAVDRREFICFEPYQVVPVGTWVVSAGPAIVRGVKVGNIMQSSMADYQGHVCQLKDEAHPGVRITVELGA